MAAVHVTVWDDREGGGAGAPALFVHNLLSWGSDPTYGFAGQRPLAAGRRLPLMDRRGYGHSPDTVPATSRPMPRTWSRCSTSMRGTAAATSWDTATAVSSRTSVRGSAPGAPDGVTPERFLRDSTEGIGPAVPEPTPGRLRAAATSMRERPIREAEIPLPAVRAAAVPVLVICGTWEDAPAAYREHVGRPLMAVAESLTESLGARLVRVRKGS